jgi:hypothetical protein
MAAMSAEPRFGRRGSRSSFRPGNVGFIGVCARGCVSRSSKPTANFSVFEKHAQPTRGVGGGGGGRVLG